LPSKLQEVYVNYEQDDPTKKYFSKGILDHADSIHVKSITYLASHVSGNTAELKYKMIVSVMSNGSKTPTDVPSTWRANLVRESPKGGWKIHELKQIFLR